METGISFLRKIFAIRVFAKIAFVFDKATMAIVVSCWGAAILVMFFTIYTVSLSVTAKRELLEAAAMEPALPIIVSQAPEIKEMEPLVARLEKRFPNIIFNLVPDSSLTISAKEGDLFRTWLTVLSYIDTIAPWLRWQIRSFCVGSACPSSIPMSATLKAEKVSFSVKTKS